MTDRRTALIVCDVRDGAITRHSLEVVGAALHSGTDLNVIVAAPFADGAVASTLRYLGVSAVIHGPATVNEFDPIRMERAVVAIAHETKPYLILCPHSIDGMGYAPAVAVALGSGFCSDVIDFSLTGGEVKASRSIYANKLCAEVDFPGHSVITLTLRAGTFRLPDGQADVALTEVVFDAVEPEQATNHIAFEETTESDVDIAKSTAIVAVGRGIGDKDALPTYAQLADALGATLACSRPIVDSGWLPKSRQVGQSGRTVTACKTYLAIGISGAAQHLLGMKHVETIIAVNKDPEAPIFQYAKYGVVADAAEFAAALAAELKLSSTG